MWKNCKDEGLLPESRTGAKNNAGVLHSSHGAMIITVILNTKTHCSVIGSAQQTLNIQLTLIYGSSRWSYRIHLTTLKECSLQVIIRQFHWCFKNKNMYKLFPYAGIVLFTQHSYLVAFWYLFRHLHTNFPTTLHSGWPAQLLVEIGLLIQCLINLLNPRTRHWVQTNWLISF